MSYGKQGKQSTRILDDAYAPYNFVPLPDKFLYYADPYLPSHDVYYPDLKSGYFEVTLTTKTPLYIRGMLTSTEQKELTEKQDKERRGGKKKTYLDDKPDFFHTGDRNKPIIPGSSLKGMLRTLMEIITYSKMQPVDATTKIFYRAVAARTDDALGQAYSRVMGRFGKNILAGYLRKDKDKWYIHPAQPFGKEAFGKVKDRDEVVGEVNGLRHFNDKAYELKQYEVVYETKNGKRGPYISKVRSPRPNEKPTAVLVCSGNMLETDDGKNESPRKNFALVLSPERSKQRIPISDRAIEDYPAGLSRYVKEQLGDNGVLKENNPVFYIGPEAGESEIVYFGHTPNFRLAALMRDADGTLRAVSPADSMPGVDPNRVDYAEAIFGYVRERQSNQSYAGRISISQAELTGNPEKLYEPIIIPRILSSPKSTAFMHYLEQDKSVTLSFYKYYGEQESRIRGHKLYWRKNIKSVNDVKASPEDIKGKESQYTHIEPIRAGVQFRFKVYFENLSDFELGALAWALTLQNDPQSYHMLGMGKPYGLGVVKLDTKLALIDRAIRYRSLLNKNDNWETGEKLDELIDPYMQTFMAGIQEHVGEDFDTIPRIRTLKSLLRLWQNDSKLGYMALERFKDKLRLPEVTEIARNLKSAE